MNLLKKIFSQKEGECVRWYQLLGWAGKGFKSVFVGTWTFGFNIILAVHWHPRDYDMKVKRFQPVWLNVYFGAFFGFIVLELWLPIWLLIRKPITMTESVMLDREERPVNVTECE